ncbi:MAG: peptidoglycan-binding protein [Clostridiales bacterium]|nr:peptidoglycan-binding protein [Clostridiales bacterium]
MEDTQTRTNPENPTAHSTHNTRFVRPALPEQKPGFTFAWWKHKIKALVRKDDAETPSLPVAEAEPPAPASIETEPAPLPVIREQETPRREQPLAPAWMQKAQEAVPTPAKKEQQAAPSWKRLPHRATESPAPEPIIEAAPPIVRERPVTVAASPPPQASVQENPEAPPKAPRRPPKVPRRKIQMPKIKPAILAWAAAGAILLIVAAVGLLRGREAIGTFVVQIFATPEPVQVAILALETPIAYAEPLPTPSPTPEPTPVPTPVPTRHPENGDVLREGEEEPIVLDIQIRLMILGYLSFEEPEEYYGEGVQSAVCSFQRRAALEPTGETDAETFRALMAEDAPAFALIMGDRGEEVAIVRERLAELGYLPAVPEEDEESEEEILYDEETAEAVSRFRKRNNLPASNEVDGATFEILLGEEPVSNYFAQGDKSDEVLALQKTLYTLGYLVGKPDGVFGKLTTMAVRRFQEEHGLTPDGCLGLSTMAALADKAAEKFSFVKESSGDDVRYLQERLSKLGYLTASQATGYYGDKTEAAIKNFQGRNGLKKTGIADAATIAKMNADNAKKAAVASSGGGGGSSGGSKGGSSSSSGDKSNSGNSGTTINYGQGIDAFIAIAKSKLGSRYVRGAKGPNTFDCSGFVYWCLNQAGVKQGYMTSIGWRTCNKYQRITDMGQLKRGDVLVFSGASAGKGHVGIYIGGGEMVDAGSSRGKVVQRSINTTYWKNHFLMAYRIWD